MNSEDKLDFIPTLLALAILVKRLGPNKVVITQADIDEVAWGRLMEERTGGAITLVYEPREPQ